MAKRPGDGPLRARLPRVVPRFADMGDVDGQFSVRVDPTALLFDVRDVLLLALGTEGAVKEARKALGDNYGLSPCANTQRVRWAEGKGAASNRGRHGRVVASAGACAGMLMRALDTRVRKFPHHALEVADWFDSLEARGAPPQLHVAHVDAAAADTYTPVHP